MFESFCEKKVRFFGHLLENILLTSTQVCYYWSKLLLPSPFGEGLGVRPLIELENVDVVIDFAVVFAGAHSEVHVHVLTYGQRRPGDLVIEEI